MIEKFIYLINLLLFEKSFMKSYL